jgi:hypothetical protein
MVGGADYTLPKLDSKYNTVKGLRQKTTRFRELQRAIHVEEEPGGVSSLRTTTECCSTATT